jgi:hypothetical protein
VQILGAEKVRNPSILKSSPLAWILCKFTTHHSKNSR